MSNTSKRALILGSLAAAGLSGCVMVPVASDGTPIYPGTYPGAAPVNSNLGGRRGTIESEKSANVQVAAAVAGKLVKERLHNGNPR